MDYYYNPVFPFLAFLASYSIVDYLKSREIWVYSIVSVATCFLLAFLLVTPMSLGPKPSLRLNDLCPSFNRGEVVQIKYGWSPAVSRLVRRWTLN